VFNRIEAQTAASNNKKETNMSIMKFKQYFRARRFAADHTPTRALWITNGEEAAFIDPTSGRVHGHIWDDGLGKYSTTVYVSPWLALRLLRQHQGILVSLLSFPCIALECAQVRSECIDTAQAYVERILGYSEHLPPL
jgi:hypothetical protein